MNLISGIDVTASALTAQKTRLDVVAQNIANAQTTRTAAGGPYQRQVVSFETRPYTTANSGSYHEVEVHYEYFVEGRRYVGRTVSSNDPYVVRHTSTTTLPL